MCPISRKEVKEAAFSLGAKKAPRPYGFQGVFLQSNWSLVADKVF